MDTFIVVGLASSTVLLEVMVFNVVDLEKFSPQRPYILPILASQSLVKNTGHCRCSTDVL